MRYLCFDKVTCLEPDKRAVSHKTLTLSDEFLAFHHARVAVMPVSLMLEALAQTGGWLHIVSRKFEVMPVLALVEGLRVIRQARQGETLVIEVWNDFGHYDGATMHGEIRIQGVQVLTLDRMVYASEHSPRQDFVHRRREHFAYVSGGYQIPAQARS